MFYYSTRLGWTSAHGILLYASCTLGCFHYVHQVVQVYISWLSPSVPVPRWQLVGFERVSVKQSQRVNLSFTITGSQMAVWVDEQRGFVVESGECQAISHVMHRFLCVVQCSHFCAWYNDMDHSPQAFSVKNFDSLPFTTGFAAVKV